MEVSYAIRTCNEVCKDQTAALTDQSSVPLLEIKRGVGIQESLVSARDCYPRRSIVVNDGLLAAAEPRPQSVE
jgi:hypothetical protein